MEVTVTTIVSGLSILGPLAGAGRLVFRTEARVEQLQAEAARLARHLEDAEKTITAFKVDHGANAAATSKDVEALKRDVERLNETVGAGVANLSDQVHALSLAMRGR